MTFAFAIQSPHLDALMASLSEGNTHRQPLLETATRNVRNLVSRHIERLGTTRHRSANSLGAEPTGHYAKAAADVTDSVDGGVGVVTIPIAGFSRAFRDLEIRPKNKRALTIPIAAEAYGKTTIEMESAGWTLFRPKRSKALFGSRDGIPGAIPLFALVAVSRQPQDRTLLPSDEELGAAAEEGAQKYISEVTK